MGLEDYFPHIIMAIIFVVIFTTLGNAITGHSGDNLFSNQCAAQLDHGRIQTGSYGYPGAFPVFKDITSYKELNTKCQSDFEIFMKSNCNNLEIGECQLKYVNFYMVK